MDKGDLDNGCTLDWEGGAGSSIVICPPGVKTPSERMAEREGEVGTLLAEAKAALEAEAILAKHEA